MDAQDKAPANPAPQPLVAAFGELPGEFAIRTGLKNTFLTARDGGRHSIDAVITAATAIGANEKFKLTSFQPDFTTIQTLLGFYVSAVGGGGLGGSHDPTQILQTERTAVADDALFRLIGPYGDGSFYIRTLNDHFLTALGGGGKTTAAFHTDATTPSTWEVFRVVKCGDLGSGYMYAIIHRAANLYLNAIGGGGQSTQGIQAIGVLDVNSHFKFIRLVDGSYALQTPNGVTYVTADDGGGIASGNNLLTNQAHIQAWETFKIVDQGNGTYAIQTISGFFLGIGPGGVISTRISDPNAAPQIGYTAKFELVMVGLVKQSP